VRSIENVTRHDAVRPSAGTASFPAKWAPCLQSLARAVFGFLLIRHGMEQLFAYPEASEAARLSYEGVLELIVFPAAILITLGLFTRKVALGLAVLYFILFFVGPLQRGPYTHRNGGDPVLLNCFFFLYLAAAGGGVPLGAVRARPPAHRCRLPVPDARAREVLRRRRRTDQPRHHDDARLRRIARECRRDSDHPRLPDPAGRVHPVG
jgi:putative oxidoreductase